MYINLLNSLQPLCEVGTILSLFYSYRKGDVQPLAQGYLIDVELEHEPRQLGWIQDPYS